MTQSWYLIVRYRQHQKLCTMRECLSFNQMIDVLFFILNLPFLDWESIQEVKVERLDK